jgi:hypothetical protein
MMRLCQNDTATLKQKVAYFLYAMGYMWRNKCDRTRKDCVKEIHQLLHPGCMEQIKDMINMLSNCDASASSMIETAMQTPAMFQKYKENAMVLNRWSEKAKFWQLNQKLIIRYLNTLEGTCAGDCDFTCYFPTHLNQIQLGGDCDFTCYFPTHLNQIQLGGDLFV